ncbi:MAG: N-(5'-phosphoribosyl)anthranilate isomerase [Candidatus Dormibacteria bacterium]
MIVKVCGVRTPEVAEAAIDAGADWIGIVFERRSPRFADDAAARSVRDAVGLRAEVVGVFVEPSLDQTDAAVSRYRLAAVQVHGDVAPEFAAQSSVPVIRGLNVSDREDALTLQWWPDGLVLLDAPAGALPGGTGRRLPVEWAAEAARHRDIVLAGGLGPDTVGDAVRRVRPYGVDASSGLETAPGKKDAALVTAYVHAAHAAAGEVDRA